MKKITSISGGLFASLGIINVLLSLISDNDNEALRVISGIVSMLLPLTFMFFLASANRKNDISKLATFITFGGCLLLLIMQSLTLFGAVKISINSGSFVFFKILLIVYLLTMIATFISVVGNNNTSDGLVIALKNISIFMVLISGIYLIVNIFSFGFASNVFFGGATAFSSGVSFLMITILLAFVCGLFSIILDKVKTFEDMDDISNQCITFQDNISKLNAQFEEYEKEKKSLKEKIVQLEKMAGVYNEPVNLPNNQMGVNTFNNQYTNNVNYMNNGQQLQNVNYPNYNYNYDYGNQVMTMTTAIPGQTPTPNVINTVPNNGYVPSNGVEQPFVNNNQQ